VDSIEKKMIVVSGIIKELGIKNVFCYTGRVEELNKRYDFITCRAVGRMSKIYPWVKDLLKKKNNHSINNAYIFLKGGDLKDELSEVKIKYHRIPISTYFENEYFETKEIVYLSPHLKTKHHD